MTIVSYGTPLYTVEQAIHILTKEAPPGMEKLLPSNARNVSAEIIDLRTVHPYDFETVERSVRKTGRLIVVTEGSKTGSVASEICADVAKRWCVSKHTLTSLQYLLYTILFVYSATYNQLLASKVTLDACNIMGQSVYRAV